MAKDISLLGNIGTDAKLKVCVIGCIHIVFFVFKFVFRSHCNTDIGLVISRNVSTKVFWNVFQRKGKIGDTLVTSDHSP